MTQMSDPALPPFTPTKANCPSAREHSPWGRLACALHDAGVASGRVFLLMFASCVLPPSLQVDTTDAGANSPPAITSVRADGVDLPEYATVNFERGTGTLNLSLWDTDVDDALSARLFVEYKSTDPTPPRASCEAGAGHTVVRSCTLDLTGLCQAADVGVPLPGRLMQLLVFDREVLTTGQQPLYQAMPEGGLSTSRTYYLICEAPST